MWNHPEFGKENMEKLQKMEEEEEDNKVYKARQKTTGKLVLIKKYKNLCLDEDGALPPSRLCEIIDFEALSESSNVFRLLYWYKNEKPSLYMMFEYLDMDLKKFIDSNPIPLQPNLIQSFMYQLCKGVAHWHKFVMFHRDLNPQNLLVATEKRILKIADLGLGTPFPDIFDNVSYEFYSLCYRSPELLLGARNYKSEINMWSVGCIFAEMILGSTLFPGDSQYDTLLHIFRLLGTPSEEQLPGLHTFSAWHDYPKWKPQYLTFAFPCLNTVGLDLLSKMLDYNPEKRISAEAALNHPYFDSLDKSRF